MGIKEWVVVVAAGIASRAETVEVQINGCELLRCLAELCEAQSQVLLLGFSLGVFHDECNGIHCASESM